MLLWYVPAPDEALLISSSKRQRLDTGFRVITGRRAFVVPIMQKARVLSLALHEVEVVEDCITSQGIHLNVRPASTGMACCDAARRALYSRDGLSYQ